MLSSKMNVSALAFASLASVVTVLADTEPAPVGFNRGPYQAFKQGDGSVPFGAQKCLSASSAGTDGFPYGDGVWADGSAERAANADGGCMDKLPSYHDDVDGVDFRTSMDGEVVVAPDCFRSCPPADANGNAAPCGRDIWLQSETTMIDKFNLFETAYNTYSNQWYTSDTANTVAAAKTQQKSAAVTELNDAITQLMLNVEAPELYSGDDLDPNHSIVQRVTTAETSLATAVLEMQQADDNKTLQSKNLREKIFELEMALLRYQDATYQEVWSRDYACALNLNQQKWQNQFRDSRNQYASTSAAWRGREDQARDANHFSIQQKMESHENQMKADEQAQRDARAAWLANLQGNFAAEDQARQDELDKRDLEVDRFLIMASVRLRLQQMFTANAEAMNSSAGSARRALAAKLSESELQLEELKSRVASSLRKTLQLDPATSAVQVTKVTPVGSSGHYDVKYEIRMARAEDAKRVAPAIGGTGKPIFQRVMKGNLEMEIADAAAKDSTVLSRMQILDVNSDAQSVRLSQQRNSRASSSSSAGGLSGISAANTKFGDARKLVSTLVTALIVPVLGAFVRM